MQHQQSESDQRNTDSYHRAIYLLPLRDLDDLRKLALALTQASCFSSYEWSFAGALYKGNEDIRRHLPNAQNVADKLAIYFQYGVVPEEARLQIAQKSRRFWQQRSKSQGQEISGAALFLASGDLLQLRYFWGAATGEKATEETREAREESISLKIFLDHVYAPQWRQTAGLSEIANDVGVTDSSELYLAQIWSTCDADRIPDGVKQVLHRAVTALPSRLLPI